MKLYIAEKPSLGRAIANALTPKSHTKDGYIDCGSEGIVTWCIGHLLEFAEPESYDEKFKNWRLDDLPIIPKSWLLTPKKNTKKQLNTIRKLVKSADQIVHAGDPDREGQLLVDELFEYLNLSNSKRHSVKRLLINDLNAKAVKKSLNTIRSNEEFKYLSLSARARTQADWLYGINQTRAWTLKCQQAGASGVVSVGRVQTPVLGLIVERDLAIEEFQPHAYYAVKARIFDHTTSQLEKEDISITARDVGEELFSAIWIPSDACHPHMDGKGRVINKKLAQHVCKRIRNQNAYIKSIDKIAKQLLQPLPYNLSGLQIDASKAYGFSAKQTLDICQTLYEQHQLITYPRSDCQFLPEPHHPNAASIFDSICTQTKKFLEIKDTLQFGIKTRAFNDKKVTAHHAIIPTQKNRKVTLSSAEDKIYRLIASRYLMQFLPVYKYNQLSIHLLIDNGHFQFKDSETTQVGWKLLSGFEVKDAKILPPLHVGQILWSGEPILEDKQTEPPQPFTDASLLSAMTGISRYVKSPELKAILRETDGLGTEATRASIIELLIKRCFVKRAGKTIHSTDSGRALIQTLPSECSLPDMTAHWEAQLSNIADGAGDYQQFINSLEQYVVDCVATARQTNGQLFQQLVDNQKSGEDLYIKKGKRLASRSLESRTSTHDKLKSKSNTNKHKRNQYKRKQTKGRLSD